MSAYKIRIKLKTAEKFRSTILRNISKIPVNSSCDPCMKFGWMQFYSLKMSTFENWWQSSLYNCCYAERGQGSSGVPFWAAYQIFLEIPSWNLKKHTFFPKKIELLKIADETAYTCNHYSIKCNKCFQCGAIEYINLFRESLLYWKRVS